MYVNLIPVPISLIMIVFYMIARNRNDLKRTAFIQPAAILVTLIITSLSFFSPYSNHEYTIWILAGISSRSTGLSRKLWLNYPMKS
jgi:hypothetical protein